MGAFESEMDAVGVHSLSTIFLLEKSNNLSLSLCLCLSLSLSVSVSVSLSLSLSVSLSLSLTLALCLSVSLSSPITMDLCTPYRTRPQPRDEMERWDSVTDTWTVIPLLNRRTAGMAFVLGPVLVYAGGTDTVNPIANVDFYTWNATIGANDTLRTAPWLAGVRQYAGCVIRSGEGQRVPWCADEAQGQMIGSFLRFTIACP